MQKKYYLTLDTETATLPFVNEMELTVQQKKAIAIAKPIIYDIGWVVSDRNGNIVKEVSYLVQETFFNLSVFNTAYYREKRSLYFEKLKNGNIGVQSWHKIMDELEEDLKNVALSTAYNACFDFKKAIPFTEQYIEHLYSPNPEKWLRYQKKICTAILEENDESKNPDYLKEYFLFRGYEYPICDLWGVVCKKLLNNRRYKAYCLNNSRITQSGLYFSTSAETAFQYLMKNTDFVEEHTALSDALIEMQILTKVLTRYGVTPEIEAFPFRALGEAPTFAQETKSAKYAQIITDQLEAYYMTANRNTSFARTIEKKYDQMQDILSKSSS